MLLPGEGASLAPARLLTRIQTPYQLPPTPHLINEARILLKQDNGTQSLSKSIIPRPQAHVAVRPVPSRAPSHSAPQSTEADPTERP